MHRYMNLMTDYAFKAVFGSVKNKKITIRFLNRVLNAKDQVTDIVFVDKEKIPYREDGKRVVFDIYCITESGRHIIIEMQRRLQPTFEDRCFLYWSYAMMSQAYRGKGDYHIDDVYGVFVMNFSLQDHEPVPFREVGIYDFTTRERFSDKMKFYFLDLTMMTREKFEDCKTPLERYMFIIKNSERMKEKPEGYPEFDDLFEALDTTSMACEDVVEYSNSRTRMIEEERDMRIYGNQQREEGLKEGKKEGLKEGKLSKAIAIAKNLLGMNMEPSLVASTCGLDLDQVKLLAKDFQ